MFAVRRLVFPSYHIVTVDFHMASFVSFGEMFFWDVTQILQCKLFRYVWTLKKSQHIFKDHLKTPATRCMTFNPGFLIIILWAYHDVPKCKFQNCNQILQLPVMQSNKTCNQVTNLFIVLDGSFHKLDSIKSGINFTLVFLAHTNGTLWDPSFNKDSEHHNRNVVPKSDWVIHNLLPIYFQRTVVNSLSPNHVLHIDSRCALLCGKP